MGALVWEKVVHHHQGWRLLSSMWLHAGVLHLVANMLCLLFVGMRLEQQFGYGEELLTLLHSRAAAPLPALAIITQLQCRPRWSALHLQTPNCIPC